MSYNMLYNKESLKNILKNVTNGTKYITNKLNKYNLNKNFYDDEIVSLLQHHPTKKIENIEYLIVKLRPPFNTRALYFYDNKCKEEDDVSYKMCIQNLFGKYKKDNHLKTDTISSFRNEIHEGTKKEFFLKNTFLSNDIYKSECSLCNKYITTSLEDKDINVDHYPIPFSKILDDFLELNEIKIESVSSKEIDNIMKLEDDNLSDRWKKYHDSKASYRILCEKCNTCNGSYGYKKNKKK